MFPEYYKKLKFIVILLYLHFLHIDFEENWFSSNLQLGLICILVSWKQFPS